MKTKPLKNYSASVGCEVYDFDITNMSPDESDELGKIVADNCIVRVGKKSVNKATRRQLYDVQMSWGSPCTAIMQQYVMDHKIKGRHWRPVLRSLGQIARGIYNEDPDLDMSPGMVSISFDTDEKTGKPIGMFTEGKLGWHQDQAGFDDGSRIIGLSSYKNSKGSETDFLSTHDAWMKMSSDMQSTIKELRVIHNWTPEDLGPVSQEQLDAARYNGVPIDGMQTSLYNETASGVPGYNYPNLSFAGFVGMSQKEGKKLHKALWKAVNKEKWIHRQFWQDGQLVYMDQNITVHQRPTVKAETPLRQMTRTVSYMDRLYPGTGAATMFDWKGIKYTPAEFAILVDADRLRIFKEREAQEKR